MGDKMKKINYLIFGLFLFAFIGCSTVSVTTDYDPATDFSTYNKYTWHTGKTIPGDELAKNPLVKNRFVNAIDKFLQSKGYEKVESDADFVVVIHAGSKDKIQVTNTGAYGGYGWYDPWWGPYGGTTMVSYYEEGTLVIDFVDTKEKELSWRGLATKTLGSGSIEQNEIDEIVQKVLDRFPPGDE